MSRYIHRFWIIVAVLLSILWSMATSAFSETSVPAFKTVVLDPGHGGNDGGAHGPTGSLEKDICLGLVRILADQLAGEYQVFFTRNDDYNVELRRRTAGANHNKADFLISIHCGAGFHHTRTGMAVYYWKPGVQQKATNTGQGSEEPNRWDETQLAHLAASHRFARDMQESLKAIAGDEPVRLRQSPLLVLQGAAMPAILIEIGNITHPATEKNLLSPQWRWQLARMIHSGIDLYLENQRIDHSVNQK